MSEALVETPRAHRPAPAAGSSLEKPPKSRILIVDDDERNAFAVSTVLEELGQVLVVARSGEEALRHLLQDDFAVILLDLHMPGMDGYETAALIRARQRTRHIPIVFLTAVYRDESHLFQAYSAGAVDIVFKPVDPFVLKAKVAVFVDLYLKTAAIQREAELRSRLQEENFRIRTEKLLAEQALRRSQLRHEAILMSLPIVVQSRFVEPPFAPVFVSDNVEAVTGFSARRMLSEPEFSASRLHPDDRDRVFDCLAAASSMGSYEIEYRWMHADGTYHTFLDSGLLAPVEDGKPRELFGTLYDVTERRQLEQQLLQAQKMEMVGQLTGGLAHDFNNLLTVVLGNIDLITKRISGDDRTERQFAAMRQAAEHGRNLTRQLLAFSRRQPLTPETIDVNGLIRNFEPLLRQALGESIAIDMALGEGPLAIFVDPSQLEAALLNLAVNARDAMPDGGQLTIRSGLASADDEVRTRFPEAGSIPLVVIAVVDTGNGMPRAVLERVFEPFFTTKDVGKGSGLGLSQVYGFVRQSGGFVLLDSAPGEGTSMRLYFPQSAQPMSNHAALGASEHPPRVRSETILLVEDDPAVLALAREMLSDLGYRVVTATDAKAAIDFLRGEAAVDLVLTDIVMPGGKTGFDIASQAEKLRPGIKVLLSSGYAGDERSRHPADHIETPFIGKPYGQAELAKKIESVLQRRSAGA